MPGPFGVCPCVCLKPHVRISHQLSTLSHTKCLCWIVPGSRATFSASCTIFGEIQRSHSPTDDDRDRARFLYNELDKRALTSFE